MVVPSGTLVLATATIPDGETTTDTIGSMNQTPGQEIQMSLCGIQIPASFTGTSLSFLAATSLSGPFQPVYNKSGQVTYTVAAGRYVAIDPSDFYGVVFLQIVSNASEGASRALICSMKGI
jgi:hypothetical protein